MKNLFSNKEKDQKINDLEGELEYLKSINDAISTQIEISKNKELEKSLEIEALIANQSKNEKAAVIDAETQKQLTKTQKLLTQTRLELKLANERIVSLGEKNVTVHLELKRAVQSRDNSKSSIVRIRRQRDRLRALQSAE